MANNTLLPDGSNSPHKFSLSAEIRTHPLFMAIVAVAVIVIIYYLYKNAQNGQTSTGTGLGQVASDGQPFLSPIGTISGGQQQPIGFPPTGNPPPPPLQGGNPPLGGFFTFIRNQNSALPWDKTYSGIPIRSAPGQTNSFTGLIPFGTQVQIVGPSVTGASNRVVGAPGSNIWWPVAGGGYVSGFDVPSA